MIYWQNWPAFIHMGGYGLYVWGSVGVTAALVVAELWQIRARRRRLQAETGWSES